MIGQPPPGAQAPLGGRLRLRMRADLRLSLLRNGYALVLNTVLTSVVGVGYWVVAAREYSPHDVGLDSAAISAMMFLAGVSQLNLNSALIRFIPRANARTRRLVLRSYLLSTGIAAVVATIFLVGLRWWAPQFGFLASSPLAAGGFVLATMAWCVFILQDGILTGLRQSRFVPLENAAFSLAKVVLVVGLAAALPHHGIFTSWTVALVVALVPTNVLIFRVLIPRHVAASEPEVDDLSLSTVARFMAGDYLGFLFWLVPTTILPVIVAQVAGPTANAYFSLAWVVANTLFLMSAGMGSSLVAEAATDPGCLPSDSRKTFARCLMVVGPAAALIVVTAPLILALFGSRYADGGATLLRLLALSAIPNCANAVAVSVARAQRRMAVVVGLLASLCSLVVGLSMVLLHTQGITGVGVAWLVGQSMVALAVARPVLRATWSTSEVGSGPSSPGLETRVVDVVLGLVMTRPLLIRMGGWLRSYPDRRRREAEINDAVPAILGRLADNGHPAARSWTVIRVVRTVSDVNVVVVGWRPGATEAIVKFSRTEAAARSLLHQDSVIDRLAADHRLDGWTSLLPLTLGMGSIEGRWYRVEAPVPGQDARVALRQGDTVDMVVRAALATVAELHRRTGVQVLLDQQLVASLVDEHFCTIQALLTERRARKSLAALTIWWDDVRTSLEGRRTRLAWTHGDYFPGNVLIGPDAAVTGIVDWEQARERDLPIMDVLNWLLTTRMILRRQEFGDAVRDVLDGDCWSQDERRFLADETSERELPLGPLVRLCWAHHVAGAMTKSPAFASNPVWVRANIDSVLGMKHV